VNARVNRKAVMVAGVAAAIGALVLGATAFAGGRPSTRASSAQPVAIGRAGRTATSVTPGSRRDVAVLDAGTITLTVDGSGAAFKVNSVKAAVGWLADVVVRDGTHVAVVFTGTRRVDVALQLDAGVLVVTITEATQGDTPSTTATTASSSSSSSSSTSVAPTTTATTVSAPATTATVASTTAAPATVASTSATTIGATTCQGDDNDGDDERDDRECDEADEHHTTTKSSVKTSSKEHDDDPKHDDDRGSDDD
jgi:hypothetical protein